MILENTVDMQEGYDKGSVNLDKHVRRKHFRGVCKGGPHHKVRMIRHEYTRVIFFRGETGDLLRIDLYQGFILPDKKGFRHSLTVFMVLILPI
jgi:hypothetical protein